MRNFHAKLINIIIIISNFIQRLEVLMKTRILFQPLVVKTRIITFKFLSKKNYLSIDISRTFFCFNPL